MRRPRCLGVLAVAIVTAAGCEDPIAVTTAATPSPLSTGSPSPGASTSPNPNGSKSPSPSGSSTATPTPSASYYYASPGSTPYTATPTPYVYPSNYYSPPPSPSPSPSTAGLISVLLNAPSATQDFTATGVQIVVQASPGTGITLAHLQVFYDGAELFDHAGADTSTTIKGWNPNVVNNVGTSPVPTNASPVPFGQHTIFGRAITSSGLSVDSSPLSFYKPLVFQPWLPNTGTDPSAPLPALPAPRTGMQLYANQGYLFGFFGEQANGVVPTAPVVALGLGLGAPTWTPYATQDLVWRKGTALAGLDATVYLAGGRPPLAGKAGQFDVPTTHVDAFNLFDHTTVALPDLPLAICDAAAAVLNNYLYVVGGTTTGLPADASRQISRIQLNSDGTVITGATWQKLLEMPTQLRGASACVGGNQLYILGGQATDGSRRESIMGYNDSANTWTRTQVLPAAVSDGAAVDLQGSIYFLGGYGNDNLPTANVFRFDYGDTVNNKPVKAFSVSPPNLPQSRARLGATVVTDPVLGARLFIAGGERPNAQNVITPLGDALVSLTL